jgi:hypothetical protein
MSLNQEKLKTVLSKTKVSDVFSTLYEVIDASKKAHQRAEGKSYAKHVALEFFYESIQDKTDTLIESYQGKYGIQDWEIISVKVNDITKFLKNRVEFFENNYEVFKDSFSRNLLDGIIEDFYRTIYKLENLQ